MAEQERCGSNANGANHHPCHSARCFIQTLKCFNSRLIARRSKLSQIPLQTPIPSAGSVELVAVAILVWFLVVVFLRRTYGKQFKDFGEIAFFLLFFVGVLLLLRLVL